jgi:CHASE2 domain-containing sensor protein
MRWLRIVGEKTWARRLLFSIMVICELLLGLLLLRLGSWYPVAALLCGIAIFIGICILFWRFSKKKKAIEVERK